MSSLPEHADEKLRHYFEYCERRLQGQDVSEIAEYLGYHRDYILLHVLKESGFPVCEECGETPAPAGHCYGASRGMEWSQLHQDFPGFAERKIEELAEIGLSGTHKNKRADRAWGCSVRLADGRTAHVELARWGVESYRAPRVIPDSPTADRAILAALVSTEAASIDPRRIRIMSHLRDAWLGNHKQSWAETKNGFRTDPVLKDATIGDLAEIMNQPNILDFLEALTQHYPRAPRLNELSTNERAATLQRLYERVKDVSHAADKLQELLELGIPEKGLPRKKVRDAERYIFAAELSGALKLNSVEVGEFMGLPLNPEYYKSKHQNKVAGGMIGKGRGLLLQIFGSGEYLAEHFERIRPALKALYDECSLKSSEFTVEALAQAYGENELMRVLVSHRKLVELSEEPIEDGNITLVTMAREFDLQHETHP